jgi:hypothetical protein
MYGVLEEHFFLSDSRLGHDIVATASSARLHTQQCSPAMINFHFRPDKIEKVI